MIIMLSFFTVCEPVIVIFLMSVIFRANDSLSSLTASQSQDSCFDQTSCSSCSPSKCDPSESSVFENNIYQNVDSDSLLYEIPPPPSFFSSKRYSDPLQQCSTYQNVSLSDTSEEKGIVSLYCYYKIDFYNMFFANTL